MASENQENGVPEWTKYGDRDSESSRYMRADMAPDNFLSTLHYLNKENLSPEKIERAELELERDYKATISMGESMNMSVLDLLSRTHAPWPYNTRMEAMYFDGAFKEIQYAIDLDRVSEKQKPWIYRVSADLEQQAANMRLLFSTGGSTPGYYDVLNQMLALKAHERFHATAEDMMSAFGEKDPGLTDMVTDKSELRGLAKEGLRGEIIKKQDEFRLWGMAIAAVGQWDDEEQSGKETFMALTPQKVRFTRLLFGSMNENPPRQNMTEEEKKKENVWVEFKVKKGTEVKVYKVPREINNWYSTGDKVKIRREYKAKAVELLNYRFDQTGESIWDRVDKMSDNEVKGFAAKINELAKERQEKWKNPYEDLDTRIAKRVVDSWIMYDLGFMAAGNLGWHFKYETKPRTNEIVRTTESGGIYKAWDVISGRHWALRKHAYDATWKSDSTWLTGTSHVGRVEFLKHKPGWAPPLEKWLGNDVQGRPIDANLQTIWKFWFDPSFEDARKDVLYGLGVNKSGIENANIKLNIDPDLAQWLSKDSNPWAWISWIDDEPGKGKNLVIPMFFPHTIDELNLWDYVGKKEGESIWAKFCRGVKPSEIDWESQNFEMLDRHWVNLSMLYRFLRLMIDPNEGEKDPSIQAFFADIGTSSIKDLSKRIFLMFRDLPDNRAQKLMIALVPYAVIQHTANKYGIFGSTAMNSGNMISDFLGDCAKWVQAFQDLPAAMGGDLEDPIYKNFGNNMAILAAGYVMRFLYMGQAAEGMTNEALGLKYSALKNIAEGNNSRLGKMFARRTKDQPEIIKLDDREYKLPLLKK